MSKPKLYIHIGTHKTGTTAIQQVFWENRKHLRKLGVEFIKFPREFTSSMYRDSLDSEVTEGLRAYLIERTSSYRAGAGVRYLLSWEGFSGNPWAGYRNASVMADCISSVTDGVADPHIMIYLRRQDGFIESLYTQHVHEGGSLPFREFINQFSTGAFDWESLLQVFAERFGESRLTVRHYDRSVLPRVDSLLSDFFAALEVDGVDFLSVVKVPTPNKGYSRDALELARMANPHLYRAERKRLRNLLQYSSAKQPFDNYTFWLPEERQQYLATFSASNARVAQRYFGDKGGTLFPAFDASDSKALPYSGLSLNAALTVMYRALVLAVSRAAKSKS